MILLAVDCEKGEGPALAKQFGVPGYPTYVMLDPAGATIASWLGYDGPDSFAGKVRGGLADPRPVAAKAAAYAERPTVELAQVLADHSAASSQLVESVGYLRKVRELDPEGASDSTSQIVDLMLFGARGGHFTLADVIAEAEPAQAAAALAGRHDEVLLIGVQVAGLAANQGEAETAAPFLKRAMASLQALPADEHPRYADRIMVAHALVVEKDPAKALALKRAGLPEGWRDDAEALNSFAWWCFENEVNLEEALALAMRGVELAGSDADRANILDTAAEICHALGDCDEAVAKIKRAIELNPEREYFREQLVRFEKAQEAAKG